MAWVKPTSFSDPDNKWNSEALSYDDSLETSANSPNAAARTWGSYIELNIASISCDKVRFYAYYNAAYINSVSIDVYYSGAWHNIYEGAYISQTWEEKAIGSTQDVTAARVRFYAKKAATAYLYEFEFNEIDSGLISGYFMQDGTREEKFGYYMNSIEGFGYYMNPLI